MHRLSLISWARYAYVAALILSLISIIPAPWFPFQLGKLAVFSILALLAAVLFLVQGGLRGSRGYGPAFAILLLPLSYVVSYAVSTDRAVGLLGYSIESDTVIFVLLGALALLVSTFLFREYRAARALLRGVCIASGIAVLFQFANILWGTRVLPAVFANSSINLVGKWNDLGLLAGAALVLVIMTLECVPLSSARRAAAFAAALVLVLFLALVQFPLIWGLLLGFCVLLGLWSFAVRQRQSGSRRFADALPWLPIVGALVSVLFLLWGATVQGGLVKVFPVSSLEVRPSMSTTLDIVRASHGASVERFALGTGPGTFGDDWYLNKPAAINQTQFWNLNFNVGYSTFATALGTVGVLGALMWLIPLLLALVGCVRALRANDVGPEERIAALCAGTMGLFLWFSTLLYVPSQNILILAFTLAGASYALTMRAHGEGHRRGYVLFVAVLACVVLLALCAGLIVRRYIAESYVNRGLGALQQGAINDALSYAAKAVAEERTGDSLQFSLLAQTAQLQATANSTSTPSQEVQQQFTQQAQAAITLGQQAIAATPGDYRSYLLLGKVYDLLATVGVQGAYDSAKEMYASAAGRNPTDPEIPLAVAHLEAVHGDVQATNAALQKTLQLKPDYTDAILFIVQLDIANKDISSAITAAKAAVNSAPGVPSIWFELGLLYYSENDMANASAALEQAVKLQSDYANAKYFLGLAYAAQGKAQDAVQQFKDLSQTNPDNSEVQLILSNLEAGKQPFDGAQPPVTSTPQDRATAPISQ